ncbi:NodT family efflux transporter outer membrane factor (OMF) lipoprotein [Wenyingzhuangia heitensis]|uniref:NodT family efflux transporter outer membrane factor (OMF) lipoprotein n=1 Tax=Wenyingzhuangia heitensis TaxID=1487859 RepID=A0ABX0UC75_9FLAO|nr:efflux transporter outer membrane subunit [Wenyingzhuangia heitensis]NIJ46440.1 NodT family efflux transporter outer membrane factor (OMF) lipoprotein [Wenyingzhuangia heitensis]
MKRNNKYTTVLMLGAITLLTSCLAVKDYKQPEVKETSKEIFRVDETTAQEMDTVSMADVSWKTMFTDTYLQEYVNQGLQNNFDLQIAIKQMNSAESYLKQGKAGYLPTFSLGANVTDQGISKNSRFGGLSSDRNIQTYSLAGNLSWEADVWGKIRSSKRASYASYLKSTTAQQAVRTELISRIVTTYYQLLALDSQLEITDQTIEVRKKGVETIKALMEAGQVTQVAVDQNVAQYNSAEALKVDLQTAIFKLENSLSILLGTSPKKFKRSVLNKQAIDTDMEIGVPALLLSNRPDVKSAQYSLMETFELKNVARTNLYPSLTLTASGGFESLAVDNWLSANSIFTNVIGGITQPIFNQRKLKTQVEVAKNNEEQALLNYRKALLVAGSEVSNALFAYEAETTKFKFRVNEAEALSNAEVNSEELLNNGYATYLDLLTARQSSLSAKLNLVDSKLQQLLTVVDLYKALGGGWK